MGLNPYCRKETKVSPVSQPICLNCKSSHEIASRICTSVFKAMNVAELGNVTFCVVCELLGRLKEYALVLRLVSSFSHIL